jgi:hypothetical protein
MYFSNKRSHAIIFDKYYCHNIHRSSKYRRGIYPVQQLSSVTRDTGTISPKPRAASTFRKPKTPAAETVPLASPCPCPPPRRPPPLTRPNRSDVPAPPHSPLASPTSPCPPPPLLPAPRASPPARRPPSSPPTRGTARPSCSPRAPPWGTASGRLASTSPSRGSTSPPRARRARSRTPAGPVIHCGDSRLLWLVTFGISVLR